MVATDRVIKLLRTEWGSLILANLIEFGMLFEHRNNPDSHARSPEAFDSLLPQMMETIKPGDVLFIVADHGNEPTTPSTDHSREHVPLQLYGHRVKAAVNPGIRDSFANLSLG